MSAALPMNIISSPGVKVMNNVSTKEDQSIMAHGWFGGPYTYFHREKRSDKGSEGTKIYDSYRLGETDLSLKLV